MREAAQDALGILLWGALRGDLVETCCFPTTLARIYALDEAATPTYQDSQVENMSNEALGLAGNTEAPEENTAEPQSAAQAVAATAGRESAELCQFCVRRSRRTCFNCYVSLCHSHAVGGY